LGDEKQQMINSSIRILLKTRSIVSSKEEKVFKEKFLETFLN